MSIPNNYKPSLFIPSQLPEFLRDDDSYLKFRTFLEAYYEWMEQDNQVVNGIRNLQNYSDIDSSLNQFVNYYYNDFLPNFPDDVVADKTKLIKLAKELYKTKGTPASFKFLFRSLYNSDCQIYLNDEFVLKPSDGVWYIPRAIRVKSNDPAFLNSNNFRIFGQQSMSIATIERGVTDGTKTDIYITDIERSFVTGETVTIVDIRNNPLYFLNGTIVSSNTPGASIVTGKIVGSISSINIDPKNRGEKYNVGDPVVVYGGLDNTDNIGGAQAIVGSVTTGSIQSITLATSNGVTIPYAGGFGFIPNPSDAFPNNVNPGLSKIFINSPTGSGAIAVVETTGPFDDRNAANVSVVTNAISNRMFSTQIGNTSYSFFDSNPSSNANSTLLSAFSFVTLNTAPITSIIVENGGGGFLSIPTVDTETLIVTDVSNISNTTVGYGRLGSLGILAPIQILNGGNNYTTNDSIVFSGGSGVGANAYIAAVDPITGTITDIKYRTSGNNTPLGGMSYNDGVPNVSVVSANGTNASLFIPGILGTPIQTTIATDRIGSITSFNILDYGEDYNSTPNVSLNIQRIPVSNLNISTLPQKGEVVFQGANINAATYIAYVASIPTVLSLDANPANTVYDLFTYNPNSLPNTQKPLLISLSNVDISMNIAGNVAVYGDGNAKANAKFYNGLIIGEGSYIGAKGQPSSYSLIQSEDYNSYTYTIIVQKEIEKYRNVIMNLLHPAGSKLIGKYAIKSNTNYDYDIQSSLNKGNNYTTIIATMSTNNSFTQKSTNIINVNVDPYVFSQVGNRIKLVFNEVPNVYSKIVSISNTPTNQIVIQSNTWLTYDNVATIVGNSNTNIINITSLTGAFDIVNGGYYSNTSFPLKDIVVSGDLIQIPNNSVNTVNTVDYINNVVYLANNITSNANGLISINRTLSTTNVQIIGATDIQYIAQLTNEVGDIITTEANDTIVLG